MLLVLLACAQPCADSAKADGCADDPGRESGDTAASETGESGTGDTAPDSGDSASDTGDTAGGDTGETGGGDTASDTASDPEVAAACALIATARADLTEGAWTGDSATCDAGTLDSGARDRALALVNAYRTLAGLPPVAHDSSLDAGAQACALVMDANHTVTSFPSADLACYSGDAATIASYSLIAASPAVAAMDALLLDSGEPTSLWHRRWLLSDWLGSVGLGSTDTYACLDVYSGIGSGGATPWTAWPPPGPFPTALLDPTGTGTTLDDVGWTLQSELYPLNTAVITVSRDGASMPVTVTVLSDGAGSAYAVAFRPDGWRSEAGATYTVDVSGISAPFSYEVRMVGC